MYADTITDSMRIAIDETMRRRSIQEAYNREHGIEPRSVQKTMNDISSFIAEAASSEEELPVSQQVADELGRLPREEVARILDALEEDMRAAAGKLDFEEAARLRDQIVRLRASVEGDEESAVIARLKQRSRQSTGPGAPGTARRFNRHAKH